MFYTSYFGNIKNIDRERYVLAAITASKPAFCDAKVLNWSELGPSFTLLNDYKSGNISEKEYTEIYLNYLEDKWDRISFYFENSSFTNLNIVMLCYEKPPKFCHRHILANFLKSKGIDCEELPYDV